MFLTSLIMLIVIIALCQSLDSENASLQAARLEAEARTREREHTTRERQQAAQHEAFMEAMIDGDRSAMRAIDPQAFRALCEGDNVLSHALLAELERRICGPDPGFTA
jgi:hypothetical protein